MCGLFAFVGPGVPDPDVLRLVAARTATRGPHACGWGWRKGDEAPTVLHSHKLDRPLDHAIGDLIADTRDAHLLIGQARLATFGDWRNLDNQQPMFIKGCGVVHNGNFYEGSTLAREMGWQMVSQSDSEALARLITAEQSLWPLTRRVADHVAFAAKTSPQAVIASEGNQLVAYCAGLPLYVLQRAEGTYLCSRSLPDAMELPSGEAFAFMWGA